MMVLGKKMLFAQYHHKGGIKMASRFAGDDNYQGVLCPLPARSLSDHPLRTGFYDQAYLAGLTASVKANDLWEPVLVRPLDDTARYEILSGHYRVRAIQRLRRATVPCQVMTCDEHTARLVFCSARIMTHSLNAIEEALLLRELVNGDGMTMAGAGELFGRSKWWVSRRLKLLAALEPTVQTGISRGMLPPRLAQELARVPRGTREQLQVLSIVQKHHLNKEELTALVDRWLRADETEKSRLSASFEKLCPGKGRRKSRPTSGGRLELQAAQQLRQCAGLMRQLTDMVTEAPLPVADWWPAPAYRNLTGAMGKLAAALGPVADIRGRGDPSIAPIAKRAAGKESF